jgi:hypothetical protein
VRDMAFEPKRDRAVKRPSMLNAKEHNCQRSCRPPIIAEETVSDFAIEPA